MASSVTVTPRLKVANTEIEGAIRDLSGLSEATFTIGVAAGAANVCTFTIQAVDGFGGTRAAVHMIDVFMSTDSGGANISATSYSTGLAATTGVVAASITANKILKVLTDATGKAVITLTATGKPATEYMCIVKPRGGLKVSVASGTNFG